MPDTITLAHGSGGKESQDLITRLFLPRFGSETLNRLEDAAALDFNGAGLLFTTDSFVVHPLEFPGGDIGKLAVCGTVNDLSVAGGRPLWLSCGLIIEEGFAMERLERIIDSMARTAAAAGVSIVCGDTKVVEHGKADGLFINTAGIGMPIRPYRCQPILAGDRILVSGTMGDHEATIFRARQNLGRNLDLTSDCAPLHDLVATVLGAAAAGVRVMRDPTRGGLGAVLNELVGGTACSFTLEEEAIPVRPDVRGLCEIVGFDPLYLANEGKLVCVAAAESAEAVLAAMRQHPLGRDAAIVGRVEPDRRERVYLVNGFGGSRIVQLPAGVQLPRIC